MAGKINGNRGNAGMGKFILKTVAVVAVGAVLFLLASPILSGISGLTAAAAGWVDGLAAQAAATWKIFAAWLIALAVLFALASGIVALLNKLFGKLGKKKNDAFEEESF